MYKQSLIPGFPDGAQRIGEALSILKQDGRVNRRYESKSTIVTTNKAFAD